MSDNVRNVIIIGSGCSGLTAAIYAARANLSPLLIEGHEPGGQLAITTLVENFPGFPDGIQGPELIDNMRAQATRFGAEFRTGHVAGVDLSRKAADGSKKPLEVNLGRETLQARTLIIASGASARWLGLPNEQALIGHGVSSCATCDGFFFSGKEIAVIGGGDSAMEEALFLTRFATKVTLIHRRSEFRASKIMLDRARKHERSSSSPTPSSTTCSTSARRKSPACACATSRAASSGTCRLARCFSASAIRPNAGFVGDQLARDGDGYLIPEGYRVLEVPGVFVSGDVADRHYRQAVTAAGTGCMAALEVEKYLEEIGR